MHKFAVAQQTPFLRAAMFRTYVAASTAAVLVVAVLNKSRTFHFPRCREACSVTRSSRSGDTHGAAFAVIIRRPYPQPAAGDAYGRGRCMAGLPQGALAGHGWGAGLPALRLSLLLGLSARQRCAEVPLQGLRARFLANERCVFCVLSLRYLRTCSRITSCRSATTSPPSPFSATKSKARTLWRCRAILAFSFCLSYRCAA